MRAFSASGCRRRLVRYLCIGICLVGCLCAAGCDEVAVPDSSFSYVEKDFIASVRGTVTRLSPDGYTGDAGLVGDTYTGVPRSFAATVSVEADLASGRVMRVAYTAPSALVGMVVTRRGDAATGEQTVTMTRAGEGDSLLVLDVPAASVAGLFSPVDLLFPKGDVSAVSPVEDDVYTVTCRSEDGEAEFTFAKGRAFPVRVTWRTEKQIGEMVIQEAEST